MRKKFSLVMIWLFLFLIQKLFVEHKHKQHHHQIPSLCRSCLVTTPPSSVCGFTAFSSWSFWLWTSCTTRLWTTSCAGSTWRNGGWEDGGSNGPGVNGTAQRRRVNTTWDQTWVTTIIHGTAWEAKHRALRSWPSRPQRPGESTNRDKGELPDN